MESPGIFTPIPPVVAEEVQQVYTESHTKNMKNFEGRTLLVENLGRHATTTLAACLPQMKMKKTEKTRKRTGCCASLRRSRSRSQKRCRRYTRQCSPELGIHTHCEIRLTKRQPRNEKPHYLGTVNLLPPLSRGDKGQE